MSLTTGFDIGFALSVGVAGLALTGAALRFLGRVALVLMSLLVLGGAGAGWITFALRHNHPRDLALAAGGMTGSALACGASLVVTWALARAAESEAQREGLARLRAELDKALEELLASAHTEVDAEASERRRALHELEERMRRREKELMERIEREEVEAAQRIRAGFEDVQRRQIEQLARTVERATAAYADEGTQQFAALVKSSREDAARRLARELDRAVETV